MVRGFAGFGTALIYVPLGALFLDPLPLIISLMVVDLFGPLAVLRPALREARRGDLWRLCLGCALLLPLGTYALTAADPALFRWVASGVALALVAALLVGWRHDREFAGRGLFAIGGAAGLLGGFTGMPGPPVILAYLSGQRYRAERIRATSTLFLLAFEWMLAATFALRGLLDLPVVLLGLLLIPAYVAGTLAGAALFRPGLARGYRAAAYLIIIGSALAGLPIFGEG